MERLRGDFHLDERAAGNLVTFLREQELATGVVPSDRTIVIERFRDEIGDWRVCILSPFGGRVHAPWAMAIAARLRAAHGIEAQSIWSDDGIALHFPESDATPPTEDLMIDPGEVEDLVVAEVGDTALFGARFRENAGRSLLIPRRRPGERTPLWQRRLKAQSLVQVAGRSATLPSSSRPTASACRTCSACRRCGRSCSALKRARKISSRSRPRARRPYSASLLFDTSPPIRARATRRRASRRAGAHRPRPVAPAARAGGTARPARRRAVDRVERQLQGAPRNPDQLHDKLRLRGDLRAGGYDPALAAPLVRERRALVVRIAVRNG